MRIAKVFEVTTQTGTRYTTEDLGTAQNILARTPRGAFLRSGVLVEEGPIRQFLPNADLEVVRELYLA